MVLRVREGVPWPITVPVIVRKDNSLSSRNITVENGSVESEPFEVASGRDVSVSFGTLPDVPPTYKGVLLVRGESLKLF